MTKLIVDCSTGEQRYEEETPEELAQMEVERKAQAVREIMQAWISLRQERDRRLLTCDWIDLPHAPLTDEQKQAWLDYRQVLRDLPDSVNNPQSFEWPKSPLD